MPYFFQQLCRPDTLKAESDRNYWENLLRARHLNATTPRTLPYILPGDFETDLLLPSTLPHRAIQY